MPRTIRVIRFGPLGAGGVPPPDLSDFARLSLPNVFQQVNTFSGLRMGDIRIITHLDSPYDILPTDMVILADCTVDNVQANLPPSDGNGQLLRLRKIDQSDNVFTVQPEAGDLLDLDTHIEITDYKRGLLIEDGMPNFWDVIVPGNLVNTSISNTFNEVTIFNGVRFTPKLITGPYEVLDTDTFLIVDCSVNDADIPILLLPALGNGQWLHIKKVDNSPHMVQINCRLGDFVGEQPGDATSANLTGRGDIILSDDLPGWWNNWITIPEFEGITLPLLLDKSRLMEDGAFLLFNPDMNTFHAVRIRGADNDSLYMEIDAGIA